MHALHFCMKNSYCQQHFLEFIKLQNVPKELSERVLDYIIGCRFPFNFQFFEASLNYWESLKRGYHLNTVDSCYRPTWI